MTDRNRHSPQGTLKAPECGEDHGLAQDPGDAAVSTLILHMN
jgi:hypothetical protein